MNGYVALMAFLFSPATLAYEQKEAINNLAHDFATCGAYYAVVSIGVKAKDPKLSAQSDEMSGVALSMSTDLSSEKLTAARVQMATRSMMEEMDNDFANASIILNKYAYLCRDLLNSPQDRMQFWLNKKD